MPIEWLTRWEAAEATFAGVADDEALSDLPALATQAMIAGWDSESLRLLAGESPRSTDFRDLRDLFEAALQELGRTRLDPRQAILNVLRFEATRIVEGEVDPAAGAARITHLLWPYALGHTGDAFDFVEGFEMLDEELGADWGRGDDVVLIAILDEAKQVLSALTI